MRRRMFAQAVTWYMVDVMIVFGFVPRVEAGFVASWASQGLKTEPKTLARFKKYLK